jgi:thiamine-monophosphate kinase
MADLRRVRDVGEFGLISILSSALPESVRFGAGLEIGIGDDAAIWRPRSGADVAITTDTLVENIHFRIDWTDWESLGHKTLAVNVSDLAAMGADPKVAVVTLGLRGDELIDDLRAFYRGLGEVARRFALVIAGGDIVRSPRALTFHVAALGEVPRRRRLMRSGAKPGDVIGVSGTLGAAAAGLALLEVDVDDPRRRATTAERLIAAHLRPEPRVALGRILLEHGASAGMDLSDGVMGDLPKILDASEVSATIDARLLPVAAAVRALFPDRWLDFVLRGGEDYELLFTAPVSSWSTIEREAKSVGDTITRIGEIDQKTGERPSIEIIQLDGSRQFAAGGAFDHFWRG